MRTSMLVLLSLVLLLPPAAAAEDPSWNDPLPPPTSVAALSGDVRGGTVEVSGTATFGGQQAEWVADDPGGDGAGMVRVGDYRGVDNAGVDLLGALLSVPDADVPELLVEWRLTNLPPTGGVPQGTRTSMAFRVGQQVYRVQAKFSNAVADTAPDDAAGHATRTQGAFQLLGNCTESVQGTGVPHCSHLAWLAGGFDARRAAVWTRVPLGSAAAPAIRHGAELRRNEAPAPELRAVFAGYHAGVDAGLLIDEAPFGPMPGYAYTIPSKEVRLGIAPKGTDPESVRYDTPADVAPSGGFTGAISTEGFAPGSYDVFARACFGTNCGIRSLGGVTVVGSRAVAVLRLPAGPNAPDHSFAFWRGDRVGTNPAYSTPFVSVPGASCSSSPCFEYTIRVETPGAFRLRVGIDASARNHSFSATLTAPDNRTFSFGNGVGQFNRETFVNDPPTGAYRVLVRPVSASNASFGLRAKLESGAWVRQPNEAGQLLPDLLPTPPYEFGFAGPINPLNGPFLAPDDANPPASVGGTPALSCSPDDTVAEQVVRCLRFSFGLSNAGVGNFDIRWSGQITSEDPGQMFQCVERAGQPPLARAAGQYQWHTTHGHWHYRDLIELRLLRVTDPATGAMVPAGGGRKIGYSPADQGFADWFRFEQNPSGTSGSAGNCVPGSGNRLGLSVGWGDVYRYQRAGNFVDFGLNPDGLYVVQLVVDPLNNVLESSDANNVTYTYVDVRGFDVRVLEQGRGQSPWDTQKQVITPRHHGGVPW